VDYAPARRPRLPAAAALPFSWLIDLSAPQTPFDYEAALYACARGERQALQRLYEQESPRLLGVVQRIVVDRALAEDIVHDAFIKIWNAAASFDVSRGTARGWMFTVARHLALNSVRNSAREVAMDDDNDEGSHAQATLEGWQDVTDAFDWKVNPGRIDFCLEQLDPVRRNCVFYAYVDGYSHQQIAQKTGAPLGTVKAWIKRSLVALRECIG
jgi:RNA polymerase sigma-70 factor (ECF subfamily)